MKKTKLLVGLLCLPTLAISAIPLTGCNLFNTIKLTFKCTEGGTLTGETSIKIKKGTPWNEIKKPTPTADAGYRKVGWYKDFYGTNPVRFSQTDTTPINSSMELTYWFGDYQTELTVTTVVDPEHGTYTEDFLRGETWANFKSFYAVADPFIEGRQFLGWYCGHEKLNDDSRPFTGPTATITARFTADFTTDSWENVVWNFDHNAYETDFAKTVYGQQSFVGLTRKVKLFGQEQKVRVIDENHDTIVDADEDKKASLTFELNGVICDENGKPLLTRFSGKNPSLDWNKPFSQQRLYTNLNEPAENVTWYTDTGKTISEKHNDSCYKTLINQNDGLEIKKVKKSAAYATSQNSFSFTIENYNAYIFPLTPIEMGFDNLKGLEAQEGRAYRYWSNNKTSADRIKYDMNSNAVQYWLSSQDENGNIAGVQKIKTDGSRYYEEFSSQQGYLPVSFAFCI